MDIHGKIALVTGGNGCFGVKIVETLLDQGATVVSLDKESSSNKDSYTVDLTDYHEAQSVIDTIIDKYGRIDILINCAGYIYSEPLINLMTPESMKHSYSAFKKVLELNLNTTFILGSIVAEKMILARTKGVIINISSIAAVGNAGQSAYSAAKAGVEAMTKTWAKELGAFSIRVNAVAPGFIDTESTNCALASDTIKHIKNNTPLRSLGKIANITHGIVYAIENDFVNSTVININGGLVI